MNKIKCKIKYVGIKKIPFKYIPKQLKMGMRVEKEHTSNKEIARAIAIAHLKEDKHYYTKLNKMRL